MLFREQTESKICVAENYLFLPESLMEQALINNLESLPPRGQAIVAIGLLPSIVLLEFENVILTQEQKQLLLIFQKQYQDISKWLGVIAFRNDETKAKLKQDNNHLVRPFADFLGTMLEVLQICLQEIGIGKNSTDNFLYLLWFDMAYSQFLESLENGGFFMPLSNDYRKSKSELMKKWENDLTPRLDAINASVNDYSMFENIGDNWERFEQRGHRIFFDMFLRWAKKNNNYKVTKAVSDLWQKEKKLIDIMSKRRGSGIYQILTIRDDGIHITGRKHRVRVMRGSG